ncbi:MULTISPECIES: lytic transglycosylase domain-containing protein [unclassified Paenibacillus]|uniref:lytic transglycosylase domain-containing protein n=1 Tax=unclassified Paenibacillus TaxID=185978 RepID=UPI00104531B0|nr:MULTISPECIES: lytic transglycosylase domain-containing protein [unclassified Paenibacillus]NIK68420.1 soluble lytic murein transglycosylase-like protein [Paenibacillus sp. BK720]TCM99293.1 transglycosylase-like protein with SLT domain [Paenibacillus sp. BK033]
MSIDPRTLKQLLQLQLSPTLDFQTAANPLEANSGDGSTSMFDFLLSQYMNGDFSEMDRFEPSTLTTDSLAKLASVPSLYSAVLSGGTDQAGSSAASDYDAMITEAAAKYGIDPELIRGVIRTESGFHSDAVSSAGAKGLMQLMDSTARGLGVTDSLDPRQNIDGGSKYLSYLLGKYNGNEQVALAAYNAGPGRIDRLGISTDSELLANLDKLPEETQRYIGKVLGARY